MSSVTPPRPLSRHELWYGRDEEPYQREVVEAGELTVELEGTQIRAVRAGDVEVLRGVYMAVRDEQWGTVAGRVTDLETRRGEGEFASRSFSMSRRRSPLSFDWEGRIAGDRSGTITFALRGRRALGVSLLQNRLLSAPSPVGVRGAAVSRTLARRHG